MQDFTVRGETFTLHPAKILIWRSQKLLVVADLHLGKAQTFLQSGLWLPPQAHKQDLSQLLPIIESYGIEHVMFLGDFVHTAQGVTNDVIHEFVEWKQNFKGRVTVVIGNHDQGLIKKWPEAWNFVELKEEFSHGDFVFRHEPVKEAGRFVWCGHIHPKITLQRASERLYLPAFVTTEDLGYLPAYSSLAGGQSFRRDKSHRYFAITDSRVTEIDF